MVQSKNMNIELTVQKESSRLLNFIKKRIPDEEEAKDILQDVFYQFVIGYEEIKVLDNVASWLFKVAQNKIIDRSRKKKPEPLSNKQITMNGDDSEGPLFLEDILPALTRDPVDELMRSVVWSEIEDALEELPEEQRRVFVLHEFEDKSFKEISAMTGESLNTLLSRKRYAVLYLRERLQELYNQLKF
ncbi:MAG: RNA polymerase sigma factor [Bacteroidales bacterium]|nr:RNA polymerase sigma factor [Bacteroidales bacterium]